MRKLVFFGKKASEQESVSAIKRGKRRGAQIHIRTIEERVYQTLKVISNSTSVLCRKKKWKKAYGIGL